MADCFAGALLMPKMAVERAFAIRNWSADYPTPAQVYVISGYFGVGYSALIYHLWKSLRLLPGSHAENLLKVGRRKAQAQALGWDSANTVWVVDPHWTGRAIDAEVGRPPAGAWGICIGGEVLGRRRCIGERTFVSGLQTGNWQSQHSHGLGWVCQGLQARICWPEHISAFGRE